MGCGNSADHTFHLDLPTAGLDTSHQLSSSDHLAAVYPAKTELALIYLLLASQVTWVKFSR